MGTLHNLAMAHDLQRKGFFSNLLVVLWSFPIEMNAYLTNQNRAISSQQNCSDEESLTSFCQTKERVSRQPYFESSKSKKFYRLEASQNDGYDQIGNLQP